MSTKKESFEQQKKRLTEEFWNKGVIDTDDRKKADTFEVIDELNYKKHPALHTKIFQDPLKDFDDKIFAPKN